MYARYDSLNLLISKCTFENNAARPNINSGLPRALLPYGHGGAIILRFITTNHSLVCIQDSSFLNNTAEANGGAIQLSIANDATYNNVIFRNCQFDRNTCTLDTCTGGVVGIDLFQGSVFNQVHFLNSNFTENMADAGGVLSLLTRSEAHPELDQERNPLLFQNCLFERNQAKQDGTVLSIFSVSLVNELGFSVFFENW